MIIYCASPYRGENEWQVWENIQSALRVAREIWRKGHIAICPHTNTMFLDMPHDTIIAGDLKILEKCDALLLTGWWEESVGCRMELKRAEELGMKIYYGLEEIPNES